MDLGENQILDIGDTAMISAMVNVPASLLDSIRWLGIDALNCDTCLQQFVAPIITSTYSIEVINEDGCEDKDDITVTVIINEDIYIPNIFSPNGDEVNDELIITTGSYIEKIISWEIFDRWGNLVYSVADAVPNSNEISWNGTYKSKWMNPAVYAYRLVVQMRDGRQVVRFGDFTLIR